MNNKDQLLPSEESKQELNLKKIESPLGLSKVVCYEYQSKKTEAALEGLHRKSGGTWVIHVFGAEYNLVPPLITDDNDPFLLKRIHAVYGSECAIAGAPAAGSSDGVKSVIARINDEVPNLPSDENLFGLIEQIDPKIPMEGVYLQLSGLHFNDGSLEVIRDENGFYAVIDFPQTITDIKASEAYRNKRRQLIGTDEVGETVTFGFDNEQDLRHLCEQHQIVYGMAAEPCLIIDGEVLTEEAFFDQLIGDTRHYIRLPVVRGEEVTPETLLMRQTVEMVREGRGKELYQALREGRPISFKPPEGSWQNSPEAMRKAFADDPVYGGDAEFMDDLVITDKIISVKGLKPGCYNHLLFGVNDTNQLVTIHIPGRSHIMIDGKRREVSGWDGYTAAEMLTTLHRLQQKLHLQVLWSGSQGRDPGAVVTFKTINGITEAHNLTTDQDVQEKFTNGGAHKRGNITSPRQVIAMIT